MLYISKVRKVQNMSKMYKKSRLKIVILREGKQMLFITRHPGKNQRKCEAKQSPKKLPLAIFHPIPSMQVMVHMVLHLKKFKYITNY